MGVGCESPLADEMVTGHAWEQAVAEEVQSMLEPDVPTTPPPSGRGRATRRALMAGAVAALALVGAAAVHRAVASARSAESTTGTEVVGLEEGAASPTSTTTAGPTPTTSVAFPNSTKDWPSLFCWLVSQTVGGKKLNKMMGWMEEKLVWEMYLRKIGLFACNDFAVFTDKRCIVSKMHPYGWPYVDDDYEPKDGEVLSWPLGATETAKNGDSSPSNVWVFVAAWKALGSSGKLDKHQFVVKQDPDAVFIPWRIRWHSDSWPSKAGTVPFFVKNCPGFGSMQGPIEIFSIAMVKAFLPSIDTCGGGSAGEDSKMEKCAQQFGQPFMDGGALDDAYCSHGQPNCNDGSKIAFHPFKSTESFGRCHEQTIRAEKSFGR